MKKEQKQNQLNKNGFMYKIVVAGSALVVATASQAAIKFDSATGAVTGSIDMAGYYSGVEVAMGILGSTIVVGLIFGALKKFAK